MREYYARFILHKIGRKGHFEGSVGDSTALVVTALGVTNVSITSRQWVVKLREPCTVTAATLWFTILSFDLQK
jgi:hypothetical protein